MAQLISAESEWTIDLLEQYEKALGEIATEYELDTFPNQIEVISSEQMMDAYASAGMPINYHHWSFGKRFIVTEQAYRRGQMGLAYELVINSNPCIAYLQEENTLTMQALVIAHACFGHNSFFKGNYLFQTWTDPDSIVDYMVFARNYIAQCEKRHGIEAVEAILDACHALMNYGVDRYKRPYPLSLEEEKTRQREREEALQQQVNELWQKTVPITATASGKDNKKRYPEEPQENLLYFLEKDAPLLEPWQREVVRIVRKFAQYLYPQRQTQVMNEGWACFWHYQLLHDMYDRGQINEAFMLEFLQSHTNVVFQPDYDNPMYSGINPYALGFSMMRDIRRICEAPTEEDRYWFPDIAGSPWLETLKFAMANFKDESFIQQFLSPKLIREMKLFSILDDADNDYLEVGAIHDEAGYQHIRDTLAGQYNLGNNEPNIQVYSADVSGDRSLVLHHTRYHDRPLEPESAHEVTQYVHRLWGFDVHIESRDTTGPVETFDCCIGREASDK